MERDFCSKTKIKVQKNKQKKKLTNVCLDVCMSAGNSEVLVFFLFFSQQCAFFKFFNGRFGKKTEKC